MSVASILAGSLKQCPQVHWLVLRVMHALYTNVYLSLCLPGPLFHQQHRRPQAQLTKFLRIFGVHSEYIAATASQIEYQNEMSNNHCRVKSVVTQQLNRLSIADAPSVTIQAD